MNIQNILRIGALIGGIAAGAVALVGAFITHKWALAGWGVAFVAGSIIAFASGATGRPDGSISPPTIGAIFKNIPMGAWLAILGLFVAATVITFIVPPWR